MKTTRFEMRIPLADRRRLRALADLAQRSESDVLRVLIRAARPDQVTPGIALSSMVDEMPDTAEGELRAA